MAEFKLSQSGADVQGLFNDSSAMREWMQKEMQKLIEGEFEKHMDREPYERDTGRSTHRNGFKDRTLRTRVGKIYIRVPQTRDGSFSPSVYEKYQRVEKALFLSLVEMYRMGVATRKIKAITEELCGERILRSTISAWCSDLDRELTAFRERPLEERYPYMVVDAQVHRVRKSRRIDSESCLVAEGIGKSGHREVIGVAMGNGESEQGWREFFLSLRKRGLRGVDMVVSDDHVGLVSAAMMCFQGSQWQRCQFHLEETPASAYPGICTRICTVA